MEGWHFLGEEAVISPQLVVNRTGLVNNIERAIALAGGAEHLWPHVKTHKTGQIVRLMAQSGIVRFKCATIAEAEMAAAFGGKHVALAYPLAGPNVERFLNLMRAFPDVKFYAIGDNLESVRLLGEAAEKRGQIVTVLIDVNMGMNRTGVEIGAVVELYERAAGLPGLEPAGLHCYDGHRTETDFEARKKAAFPGFSQIMEIREELNRKGLSCEAMIMGGTPSFPCYAAFGGEGIYFSPGTLFLNDCGYAKKFPDLEFETAAAVMTRVVSLPEPGKFTLDLGYKGIASDPEGVRGVLDHFPAHPCFQSEEHWVFAMDEGHEAECPKIGDVLFVIPTHICPTSALYPYMLVVEDGRIVAEWEVTARNRRITY